MRSARIHRRENRPTGDWSVVIVNYNGDPFLTACLEALSAVRLRPHAVYVVDNASTDSSMLELNAYPWAEAIQNQTNLGFAGGANAGLKRVETSIAVILNPDVELAPDFGGALIDAFAGNPRLGVAGALLTYPDGVTVQHAGGVINYPSLSTWHQGRGEQITSAPDSPIAIDYAAGAALALRMDAVREIDGFDEQFSPVYYEDVDLSVRAREAGWDVMLFPGLRALHHEGVTLEYDATYHHFLHRNRIRYALKHLSDSEWLHDFVPLEISRIRHELVRPEYPEAREAVGLESLDILLRELPPLATAGDAVASVPDYPVEAVNIGELETLRAARAEAPSTRLPFVGGVLEMFKFLAPRWYVDGALEKQREFNDAVVRAFESQRYRNIRQDRVNREQTAELMLLALTLLGKLRDEIADADAGCGDEPPSGSGAS